MLKAFFGSVAVEVWKEVTKQLPRSGGRTMKILASNITGGVTFREIGQIRGRAATLAQQQAWIMARLRTEQVAADGQGGRVTLYWAESQDKSRKLSVCVVEAEVPVSQA